MATRKSQYTEEQIAEQIVGWLSESGWTVYQEVQRYPHGAIADIVAIQGKLLWIIETKTVLGVDVMEQAFNWLHHAHLVSVGVPKAYRGSTAFKQRVLRLLGVGCLTVSNPWDGWVVTEEVKPQFMRRLIPGFREVLRPEHQTWAKAGNNRSERYSPFKATCRAVADYVLANPGVSLKELVENIPTHYHTTATARSCLKIWIESGNVKGVQMKREGRLIKLYPIEAV